MPYKIRTKSSIKSHSHHRYSGKKSTKCKRSGVFKTKNNTAFNECEKVESVVGNVPILFIEFYSDAEENISYLPPSITFPDKSRSLSYSNSLSVNSENQSLTFTDDTSQTKYFKNYFRRRGRSMEIAKPCIHCILEQELYEKKLKDSHERDFNYESKSPYTSTSSNDSTYGFSSVNSPTSMNKNITSYFLQVPDANHLMLQIEKNRSKSVDQVFELSMTDIDRRDSATKSETLDCPKTILSINKSRNCASTSENKVISQLSIPMTQSTGNISIVPKSIPDWSIDASITSHFWIETNLSGDLCYLNEDKCLKSGSKKKCISCKVVIHQNCLPQLTFECRPTFREAGVRDYRDEKKKEDILLHHWVHKKRQDGKCKQCGKSFQSKFSFNSKEIVAVQCTWCKSPYHNKAVCFASSLLTDECSKGQHYDSIIPPSWIIKMPSKHSFKSSVRKSRSPDYSQKPLLAHQASFPTPISSLENVSDSGIKTADYKSDNLSMTKSISLQSNSLWCSSIPFVIKPIPGSSPSKPLLLFLNPKSGGNAGVKLMKKFQWLLNPRQIFDISNGGPKIALELFGRISNLRILVCGGDGTVGWVLSEIDNLKISPSPPIAILPLGTGNDLARTTNWGGGYSDESLSKIISCVEEGSVKNLDRWDVTSQLIYDLPNSSRDSKELGSNNANSSESVSPSAVVKLPLNVFNNYFSLGADAATALEFHESREANPEKFNNRLKNKMFYAGIGGKDVLKRSWKDLSDHVTLVCDDIDYTPRIKEMKPHLLLFLNIPRYSAGTLPWGNPSSGFEPQSINDAKFEVMGLTAVSLAALQVGGHADRICQCSSAIITTTKTIPMQLDGEPFRLLPSQIEIKHRNIAQIILKPKRRPSIPLLSDEELENAQDFEQPLKLSVFVIPLVDYEENSSDKKKILESARFYGMIKETGDSTLSYVRKVLLEFTSDTCQLDLDFTFLDATTSDRFFRVGRIQENHHYLMDICFEDVFVLDPKLPSNLIQNRNLLELDLAINSHDTKINDDAERLYIGDNKENQIVAYNDQKKPNIDFMIIESSDNTFDDDQEKSLTETDHSDVFEENKCKEQCNEDNIIYLKTKTKESELENNIIRKISLVKYRDAEDINDHFLNACKQSHVELVQKYIMDGAEFLAVDREGLSGLHLATIHGNIAVVHYLINNAPKSLLDWKDLEKGQTALHKAADIDRQSICSLLISAGASLLSQDNAMKTPSQLASNPNLLQFLQSKCSSTSML